MRSRRPKGRYGVNKCRLHQPLGNARDDAMNTVTNAMRKPSGRRKFILHYQSKIDVRTVGITGVEARRSGDNPGAGATDQDADGRPVKNRLWLMATVSF